MQRGFKDHFSATAADYARWRPGYPPELARLLALLAPSRRLALDCGCGAGQLSVLLAAEFAQVVATDASAAQLEHAQAHPRVGYRCAPAERSGLDDAGVDLVTAAQAAHWFDIDAFQDEARRVLRPQGCLAIISYGLPRIAGAVGALLLDLHDRVLGPYWPPERRHVVDGLRDLPLHFHELELPPLDMRASWTAEQLLGYVGTWSALRPAEAALGCAPLHAFERELRAAWGEEHARHDVVWPLRVRAGRFD